MKKVLLIFAIFIFTSLTADASTQVFYHGGRPSYTRAGAGPSRSINSFGANALTSPNYIRAAGERRRAREFAKMRMENIGRMRGMPNSPSGIVQKTPEVSRFSKDYKISSVKSHVKNGIIYYD